MHCLIDSFVYPHVQKQGRSYDGAPIYTYIYIYVAGPGAVPMSEGPGLPQIDHISSSRSSVSKRVSPESKRVSLESKRVSPESKRESKRVSPKSKKRPVGRPKVLTWC